MMNQPEQTPLVDLLRNTPKGGRVLHEWDAGSHQNIPYGSLCHEAADEIESLRKQLAEAQAALALKDEAIDKYGHNTFCERGVAISMFKKTERTCTCYMREALAIKPDNAALREWGARLLEELQRVQIETYGGTGLLPHELREVAQDLRSGEWTPEVMK